jgi:hypothetical protein
MYRDKFGELYSINIRLNIKLSTDYTNCSHFFSFIQSEYQFLMQIDLRICSGQNQPLKKKKKKKKKKKTPTKKKKKKKKKTRPPTKK